MKIRSATSSDIVRIAEIYGDAVLNGTGSFELEPPGTDEMARRIERILAAGHAWFVSEIDGQIVGYAYHGPHHLRPAYRWAADTSVYVDAKCRGRGVGRALLDRLVEDATERGFRQMVAVIGDSDNAGSIGLHRAAGFAHAGMLKAVGYKFGRWLDVVLMQRALGPGADRAPDV